MREERERLGKIERKQSSTDTHREKEVVENTAGVHASTLLEEQKQKQGEKAKRIEKIEKSRILVSVGFVALIHCPTYLPSGLSVTSISLNAAFALSHRRALWDPATGKPQAQVRLQADSPQQRQQLRQEHGPWGKSGKGDILFFSPLLCRLNAAVSSFVRMLVSLTSMMM